MTVLANAVSAEPKSDGEGREIAPFSIAIIGAGRVGISLGVLAKRAGHRIVAACALSGLSLERATLMLSCEGTTDAAQAARDGDVVLICVPDDEVAGVVEAVAGSGGFSQGQVVCHTSGVHGLEVVEPARRAGARVVAMHPLQAIADVDAGVERIPGSWFGVTCEPDMQPWARAFVGDLGGEVLWVPDEDKALYHAAAVFASNFLPLLADAASRAAGSPSPFLSLMRGALRNIENAGPRAAVTGPVLRGDIGTIQGHLRALEVHLPDLVDLYRELSLALVGMLAREGDISLSQKQRLEQSLAPPVGKPDDENPKDDEDRDDEDR